MALVFLSVHLSLVARWRRVGEVVTICRVRAMARWWPCPRGQSPCVAVSSARFSWRCLRCLSLLALLVVAWRVARRVQALGAAGLKRGAGLTLKMKTRVDARLLVAPRGATCWYGSTHASYGVPFSSTNHMQLPARSKEQRRSGGLSPPRQLQIEQMEADSTTSCTSPRTRWRS